MKYSPSNDMLYILTNTHHAARRLVVDAVLPPTSYQICVPSDHHKLAGLKGGFYIVCSGSGHKRVGLGELIVLAEREGLQPVSYTDVIKAGNTLWARKEWAK